MNSSIRYYQFRSLRQLNGLMSPAYAGVDADGSLKYLSTQPPDSSAVEFVNGHALPGFQNAHSHAFQFAMAGHAEVHPKGTSDDFWSWREAMYACALSLDPDQMQDIAAMLYSEMLRKGYTSVAEFHYLHHDKDGRPYANLSEMGSRLVAAAKEAGINITLIPVFYQKGGFGKDPEPRQRRFISRTTDDYLKLFESSRASIQNQSHATLGFSVHSLRAVNDGDIIKTLSAVPVDLPFHIHAAEQLREVEDCLAHLKARPVEWILNHLPVNKRFHLVHCTHMTPQETQALAHSGAHAVLCPGTEGNLGDGIFRLTDFSLAKGHWSIGTDSHISLNPLEDMRWLDYGQRLLSHKRNTFDDGAKALVTEAIFSGRRAMGRPSEEFFELNKPFDAVVCKNNSSLAGVDVNSLLSRIVYTADSGDILGTIVNGKWIVNDGAHARGEELRARFEKTMRQIVF